MDTLTRPETVNKPFTVRVNSSGEEYPVPADKTLLEVLRGEGIYIMTSCEDGLCGTCLTDVLAGEPEHRDSFLTDEEHAENSCMTVCCSRARGALLVLDL